MRVTPTIDPSAYSHERDIKAELERTDCDRISSDEQSRQDAALNDCVTENARAKEEALIVEHERWLRMLGAAIDRVSESNEPETMKYCYESKSYCLVVAVVGVISLIVNAFTLYTILKEEVCKCNEEGEFFQSTAVSPINNDKLKAAIEEQTKNLNRNILDLQKRMDKFPTKTKEQERPSSGSKAETYQEVSQRIKASIKKIEESIEKEYRRKKAELLRIKMAQEISSTPDCVLQKAKENQNSTLVSVNVPLPTKGFVTVGVTCSTTFQNMSEVRYMVPLFENAHEYRCYCANGRAKPTDCIAYYWQCRLS